MALTAPTEAPDRTEWHLPKSYLSFSQVRAYLSCPACYKLAYVDNLKVPVGLPLAVGCAVHGGLAAVRRAIQTGLAEDVVLATELEFARGSEVEVPEGGDAMALLSAAIESGDARIEQYGTALSTGQVQQAMIGATKLIVDNVEKIVEPERPIGYALIEQEIWTEPGVLPFPFKAIIDCWMQDGRLDEFKTSDKARQPDYYNGLQLRLQALNLWAADIPFSLSLTQLVKNPPYKMPHDNLHRFALPVDPGHMQAAQDVVLQVAEGISSGFFPERPGWWCKFTHSVPPFVSLP